MNANKNGGAKMSVRNLRIREDTAKCATVILPFIVTLAHICVLVHLPPSTLSQVPAQPSSYPPPYLRYLLNLDVDSAYYDPKTRSMRENPLPQSAASSFVGDSAARVSGVEHAPTTRTRNRTLTRTRTLSLTLPPTQATPRSWRRCSSTSSRLTRRGRTCT